MADGVDVVDNRDQNQSEVGTARKLNGVVLLQSAEFIGLVGLGVKCMIIIMIIVKHHRSAHITHHLFHYS